MIVTGCQRSGTMTFASILNIHHENLFTPTITISKLFKHGLSAVRSESSWMAVPFYDLLKNYQNFIHLIRHPQKIVNSLIGIEFWEEKNATHKPYRDFVYDHCPMVADAPGPIEKSVVYWIEWPRKLREAKIPTIRIEDVMNAPKLNSRNRADIDLSQYCEAPELDKLMELYGYAQPD